MLNFYKQYKLHILFWCIYLFWIVLFVWTYSFIETSWLWIVLGSITTLIIHIFVSGFTITPSEKITTDLDAVDKDIKDHKIHKFYYYLILNRTYIFPALLVVYLLYLLIKQTSLRNLDHSIFFALINETTLLVLVLLSWIGTIVWEDKDKQYQKIIQSKRSTYGTLWLTTLLSLLWWYIIYLQTQSIGAISVPISGISGILIFLIWVLILEDDRKEDVLT